MGWFYSQTNSRRQLGAKLTYSGDSPFLLRLVIGVSTEQSSDTVSWLPLYVSNDTTDFRPLTCEPETVKRTELYVPFRKKLPKTSLVSIEDIRCVCPAATHMITRYVETDIRKMARKIIDDMHPHKKFEIQRFEENLTRWGPKSHFFTIGGTDKAVKVGAVSLSEIYALTVIADKEEMKGASTEIEDLFEGIWKNEVVVRPKENTDTYVKSVKVLQVIYPDSSQKFLEKPSDASPLKMSVKF